MGELQSVGSMDVAIALSLPHEKEVSALVNCMQSYSGCRGVGISCSCGCAAGAGAMGGILIRSGVTLVE